jgi:DNA-binding transcriptional MerR regulator
MSSALIRIGQAARRIGIHPQTLRRWEREERIPRALRNPLTGQRVYADNDVTGLLARISGRPVRKEKTEAPELRT